MSEKVGLNLNFLFPRYISQQCHALRSVAVCLGQGQGPGGGGEVRLGERVV